MTVGEFLNAFDQNSDLPLFYFLALPLSAFLALLLSRNNAMRSPWKYLYTGLVYLSVVPGVFVLILNTYLLFIDSQSISSFNIYTQILPIISMIVTLWLVRRAIAFDFIPGFDKLTGFFIIVAVVFVILFIIDRLHILLLVSLPFQFALLILLALILFALWAWRRYFR